MRRNNADANSYCITNSDCKCHANGESFGYGNTDGNFYPNAETHTHTKDCADAETTSNTCPAAIARN
jgi:hypothetical protein